MSLIRPGLQAESRPRFFNNSHDQFNIMLQARICAETEDFLPTDVLANLIPLSLMPTGGFLVVGRTAEAYGIPVTSALTGAKNPIYPVHRELDCSATIWMGTARQSG